MSETIKPEDLQPGGADASAKKDLHATRRKNSKAVANLVALTGEEKPEPEDQEAPAPEEQSPGFQEMLYRHGDKAEGEVPQGPQGETKLPPMSGDDELLFGPTMRPNESPNAGVNRITRGKPPIPAGLVKQLPALTRAAMEPDAPEGLRILISLIAQYAER